MEGSVGHFRAYDRKSCSFIAKPQTVLTIISMVQVAIKMPRLLSELDYTDFRKVGLVLPVVTVIKSRFFRGFKERWMLGRRQTTQTYYRSLELSVALCLVLSQPGVTVVTLGTRVERSNLTRSISDG